MSNLQLLLSICIPSFLVLVGIMLNHREVSSLRSDMNRQFDKADARFDRLDMRLARIDEDLGMFHGTNRELEGRVNELSARVK